jgi:DNA repair protein RecO (recombination protein O)
MGIVKTEAIVLDSAEYSETSKLARLFSPALGKLSVLAKGARRKGSRVGAGLEPFTHVNLTLYLKETADLGTLKEIEVIESFSYLREDLIKMALASLYVEAIKVALAPGARNYSLFKLTLAYLDSLRRSRDAVGLTVHFLLKLLKDLGLQPVVERCVRCGATEGIRYFHLRRGGVVCARCAGAGETSELVELDPGEYRVLKKSVETPIRSVERIRLSRKQSKALLQLLIRVLEYHLESQLRSVRFLEQMMLEVQ